MISSIYRHLYYTVIRRNEFHPEGPRNFGVFIASFRHPASIPARDLILELGDEEHTRYNNKAYLLPPSLKIHSLSPSCNILQNEQTTESFKGNSSSQEFLHWGIFILFSHEEHFYPSCKIFFNRIQGKSVKLYIVTISSFKKILEK